MALINMKSFLGITTAIFIAGCSTTYPLVGQLEDGTPMMGESDALAGTFWAASTKGLRCNGTFDNNTLRATITMDIKCSDGRYGKAIATRKGANASAIAELNDGTRGQFLTGPNIKIDQSFGSGGMARIEEPKPVPIIINNPPIMPPRP